jgi:hypothetical protein
MHYTIIHTTKNLSGCDLFWNVHRRTVEILLLFWVLANKIVMNVSLWAYFSSYLKKFFITHLFT